MPILDPKSLEFISRSPEQTRRVGMRLGALLAPGDLVCLDGDLGSGKTTLMQGIAIGWGSLDPVSSPTFVLINVYRGPRAARLYHMDAYRISGYEEAEELDVETMLAQGPLVIEWADRVQPVLPEERIWVHLSWISDEQRDLVFSAKDPHHQELLVDLRHHLFGVV